MITNFDNETAPLNELEQKAAAIIADGMMRWHTGKDKVISSDAICKGLAKNYECFRVQQGNGGYKPYLNGARIRKIINRIRMENLVPLLVSSSAGYYVATDATEVRDYIRSLKERASAITAVSQALTRQFREQFANNPIATMEI
jgi:hypothetical protein